MNGYTVITTQNAGEALLITEEQTQKIDLLVTDVVMPHITGVKLGTRLRSLIPELRVLLISGHPEDPSVEAELQSSPWGFLQKPFAPETLLQKVRSVLDK
jgi:DNA-binding NtrC family response regulator